MLLTTLSEDTTSRLTAYLPTEYRFGMSPDTGGRLILIKDGRFTRFLLEGTHRVYELKREPASPGIRRIDSTLLLGDNFQPIAFRRKDTLMQYGGRGRYLQRNFFTRYREGNCDWELYPNEGAYLENAWTLHQYVPDTDELFVLGSRIIDNRDLAASIRDTAYRFDFDTRCWSALGCFNPDLPYRPFQKDMAHLACHFDGGSLLQVDTGLLWVDISGNRWRWIPRNTWYPTQEALNDRESPLLLVLGRNIHSFLEKPDGPEHNIHLLPVSYRAGKAEKMVYQPIDEETTPKSAFTMGLIAMGAIAIGILTYRRRGRVVKQKKALKEGNKNDEDPSTVAAPDEALGHFVREAEKRLSREEWVLLRQLITRSALGEEIDTSAVNDTLGITGMKPTIQKTRRMNAFMHINRLYLQTVWWGETLVVHERDASQGRSFRYRIRKDLSEKFRKIIGPDAGDKELP